MLLSCVLVSSGSSRLCCSAVLMLLSYARDSDFDSEPISTKMSAVPEVLELGFGQLSLALYASDTGLGEVLVLLFR